MNEKFIRERYVRYGKKIKNGYISDRKRILEEYNEIHDPITEIQLKRYIATNNLIALLSGDTVEEEKPKESITRYEDGSMLYDRLIKLHDNELNDDTVIMQAFNLDPSKWLITSATFNLWSVDSKDRRLNNYQAKVKVKPKTKKDLTVEDFKKIMGDFEYKVPKRTPKVFTNKKIATVFIADDHVNQVGFSLEETYEWVAQIKQYLLNEKPEHVNINFLGDVLHVDNVSETTNKGTQLKIEGTVYDMSRNAMTHVTHIIDELSITNTTVRWVQGNHSRLAEFLIMMNVENSFRDNKFIEFDVSESRRKAYMTYDWLTGILHGDMPNKNKGYWLSTEYAELWGKSLYREQYEGHLHHSAKTNYGSLSHTTMTTKAKQTDYEVGLGYDNHMPNVEVHIYYEGSRQKQIKTF